MKISRHSNAKSMLFKILVLVFVFALPADSYAGQLHTHYITMMEIARYGYAVLGTVVSVSVSQDLVRARVKRAWAASEGDGGEYYPAPYGERLDSIQDYKIYSGLVWEDPNMSPVDQRVRGAISITQVKVGQDVIFVPNHGYEMLPADEETIGKLDLFFSADALEKYKRTSPPEVLYGDLKDPDLRQPALDAMCERSLLGPSVFLALDDYMVYELGWKLAQKLSPREFDAWLLSMIRTEHSKPQRMRLVGLAREFRFSERVSQSTYIALLNLLDQNDDDQAYVVRWFVRDEADILKHGENAMSSEGAELAVDFSLSLMNHGQFGDWQDKDALRTLLSALPEQKQIEKIRYIGHLVMNSDDARKSKLRYDAGPLELFLEQIKRLPSLAYLPELRAIDISRIPDSDQDKVESHSALLDAGWVLSRAFPSESKTIYDSLKRWSLDESVFNPAIVLSIDSEKPEAKQERWRSSLERFKTLKSDP